jgi:hypothetical protein
VVREHFPQLTHDVVLETDDLHTSQGHFVEIPPESWLEWDVETVYIRESQQPSQGSQEPSPDPSGALYIFFRDLNFRGLLLLRHVESDDADTSSCVPRPLPPEREFVHVWQPGCRKPVIYLFSPTDIDVTVTLTLDDEWSLSVVYPVVPIKALENDQGSQVQWNVCAHQDGSLSDRATSLDVSYLFWEAECVFILSTWMSALWFTFCLSSSIGLTKGFSHLLRHHVFLCLRRPNISVLSPAIYVIRTRYCYLSVV